ncbi:hypothetical protein D3C72_1490250 [compost metagenome]
MPAASPATLARPLEASAARMALTMASAMPSPATRVVLKMPAAMPARSFGTTLTERPSMRPHGMPAPTPISSIGSATVMPVARMSMALSQCRPMAAIRKPRPDSTPGEIQRVSVATAAGTTSIGSDSAIIRIPASISLRPTMPMNRSGSMMIRTM